MPDNITQQDLYVYKQILGDSAKPDSEVTDADILSAKQGYTDRINEKMKSFGEEPFQNFESIDVDKFNTLQGNYIVSTANSELDKMKAKYKSLSDVKPFESPEEVQSRYSELNDKIKNIEDKKTVSSWNAEAKKIKDQYGIDVPTINSSSELTKAQDRTKKMIDKYQSTIKDSAKADFYQAITDMSSVPGGARGDIQATNLQTQPSENGISDKVKELQHESKIMYGIHKIDESMIPQLRNYGVSDKSIELIGGPKSIVPSPLSYDVMPEEKTKEEAYYRAASDQLGTDISNIDNKLKDINEKIDAPGGYDVSDLKQQKDDLLRARGVLVRNQYDYVSKRNDIRSEDSRGSIAKAGLYKFLETINEGTAGFFKLATSVLNGGYGQAIPKYLNDKIDSLANMSNKGIELFLNQTPENVESKHSTAGFLGSMIPYVTTNKEIQTPLMFLSEWNSNEKKYRDLPETQKFILNAIQSSVSTYLMSEGLDVSKGHGAINSIVLDAIESLPKPLKLSGIPGAVADMLKEVASGGLAKGLSFAALNPAIEGSKSIIDHVNNLVSDKQVDVPDFATTVGNMLKLSAKGLSDGVKLGSIMAPANAYKTGMMNEETFKSAIQLSDQRVMSANVNSIKQAVADGVMTKDDAEKALNSLVDLRRKISQIPSDMSTSDAYSVWKLMNENDRLSQEAAKLNEVFKKPLLNKIEANKKEMLDISMKHNQEYQHENEGATSFRDGKNIVGEKLSSVSLFPERSQIVTGDVTQKQIDLFKEQNKDLLEKNSDVLSVNTWKDGEGNSHLDISAALPHNEAIAIAKKYDKESIFNLEKMKETSIGGNNTPIEESEANRLKDIRKELRTTEIDESKFSPKTIDDIRAINPAIADVAEKGVAAVSQRFPNIKVQFHDTNASMQVALKRAGSDVDARKVSGNFSYKPSENGVHDVTIDINMAAGANAETIRHELGHAALLSEFGDNPDLFDKMKSAIRSFGLKMDDKDLVDFSKRYDKSARAEEYLVELAARSRELKPGTLANIAEYINNIVSKVTGGRFTPFKDVHDANEAIRYFDSMMNAIRTGSKIEPSKKEGIKHDGKSMNQLTEERDIIVDGKKMTVKPIDVGITNGFYSPLEKATKLLTQENGTGEQMLNMIKKIKDVTADELKWTGLENWLKQQGKVTKADILDYLKNNRVQLAEVVKGTKINRDYELTEDPPKRLGIDRHEALSILDKAGTIYNPRLPEFLQKRYGEKADGILEYLQNYARDIGEYSKDTKFSQYQQSGDKSNYREILVTMPKAQERIPVSSIKEEVEYEKKGYYIEIDFGDNGKKIAVKNPKTQFQSPHWDERDIIGHLRISNRIDSEGNKVLHITEIQSDWGQKGKKEGFKDNDLEKANNEFKKYTQSLRDKYKTDSIVNTEKYWTKDEKEKYHELREKTKGTNGYQGGVEQAPFVTNTSSWVKLLLKHAIREGVKDGATKVTWETGETQNERYNLSKRVDEISTKKYPNGTYTIAGYKDGYAVFEQNDVPENKIEEYVGKDLAEKITTAHNEQINYKKGAIKEYHDFQEKLQEEYGKAEVGVLERYLRHPNNENSSDSKTYFKLQSEANKEYKANNKNDAWETFTGQDLKVGGKGMIGFYGSPTEGTEGIVGKSIREVVKGLTGKDVRIGETEIETGSDKEQYVVNGRGFDDLDEAKDYAEEHNARIVTRKERSNLSTQHSIEITPELKAAVEKGMPLFSKHQLNEMASLRDQIKLEAKAAKEGERGIKDAIRAISDKIYNMAGNGDVAAKQAAIIAKRLSYTNIHNDESVNRFLSYASKVFDDAEYADKLKTANTLRKKIKPKSDSDTLPLSIRNLVKSFSKISPSAVSDIDKYNKIAESVWQAVKPGLIRENKDGTITDSSKKAVNIESVNKYIESQEDAIEKAKKKYEKGEDSELEVQYLKDKVSDLSGVAREMLDNESDYISDEDKRIVNSFIEMKPEDKYTLRLMSEALDHFIVNGDTGLMPHVIEQHKIDFNIKKGVGVLNDVTKEGVKRLPVESTISSIRAAFNKAAGVLLKKNNFSEAQKDISYLLNSSLTRIDNLLKNFENYHVFKHVFRDMAAGFSGLRSREKQMDAMRIWHDMLHSFNGNIKAGMIAKYKITMYLRQLEHESNPGSKKSLPAIDYINETIESSKRGENGINATSRNIIRQIADQYTVDGHIDKDKLYESMSDSEKMAVKKLQDLYKQLLPYAKKVSIDIRNNPFNEINNYVSIATNGGRDVSGKMLASELALDIYSNISTKAGQIEERTGKASSISMDPFYTANRAVRSILLDYYMTTPLRTLNGIAKGFVEDSANGPEDKRLFAIGLKNIIDQVNSATLSRSFFQRTPVSDVFQWISKRTIFATLSRPTKAIAETGGNIAFNIPHAIVEMTKGMKYAPMFMNSHGGDVLDRIGSVLVDRLYPHGTDLGRIQDPETYDIDMSDRENVPSDVWSIITQLHYNSFHKALQGGQEIGEFMLTAPDLTTGRTLWYGAFAHNFEKLTGDKIDFDKLKNDNSYFEKHKEAIYEARDIADKLTVDSISTKNPYMQSPRLTVASQYGHFYGQINNYIAGFARKEFEVATDAVIALWTGGKMSRTQAARTLLAVTLRAGVYTGIRLSLLNGMKAAGFALAKYMEDDKKKDPLTATLEEGDKLTRQEIAKRELAYTTEHNPSIPGVDKNINVGSAMNTIDDKAVEIMKNTASEHDDGFVDNFKKGVAQSFTQYLLNRNFGSLQNSFITAPLFEYAHSKIIGDDAYNRYQDAYLYSAVPSSKRVDDKWIENMVRPFGAAGQVAAGGVSIASSLYKFQSAKDEIESLKTAISDLENNRPNEKYDESELPKLKDRLRGYEELRDKYFKRFVRESVTGAVASTAAIPGLKDVSTVAEEASKDIVTKTIDWAELNRRYEALKHTPDNTIVVDEYKNKAYNRKEAYKKANGK